MSLPNLSSFRGVNFNEDTTSTGSQPARPSQNPITSVEHAAFSDINIIETGGMGHSQLSIPVLVDAASWNNFLAGKGQFGTLVHFGTTRSTAALLVELTGERYLPSTNAFVAQATWVW